VGPRTGLDVVAKRKKILAPTGNPTPVVQPVTDVRKSRITNVGKSRGVY
jgi:hypothetical protein